MTASFLSAHLVPSCWPSETRHGGSLTPRKPHTYSPPSTITSRLLTILHHCVFTYAQKAWETYPTHIWLLLEGRMEGGGCSRAFYFETLPSPWFKIHGQKEKHVQAVGASPPCQSPQLTPQSSETFPRNLTEPRTLSAILIICHWALCILLLSLRGWGGGNGSAQVPASCKNISGKRELTGLEASGWNFSITTDKLSGLEQVTSLASLQHPHL